VDGRKPRKPRKLDRAEFWLMTNDPEYMARSEDWRGYQRESLSGTPSPHDYYAPPDVVVAIETHQEDEALGLMAWLAFKADPKRVTQQMMAGWPLWQKRLEQEGKLYKEPGVEEIRRQLDEIKREIETRTMALLTKIHPRRCACGCGELLTDWTHRSDATYFSRSHQMRALMRERRKLVESKALEITMLAVSTSPSTGMYGEKRPERTISMTTTIPERVESLETRQSVLEETFRSALEDVARAATEFAARIPEDGRIAGAVDRLLADIEEIGS